MKPKHFSIHAVADRLEGTDNSVAEALLELYPEMEQTDWTTEDYDELTHIIFNCDECGQWFNVSDRYSTDGNGDQCESCNNNFDEDDTDYDGQDPEDFEVDDEDE